MQESTPGYPSEPVSASSDPALFGSVRTVELSESRPPDHSYIRDRQCGAPLFVVARLTFSPSIVPLRSLENRLSRRFPPHYI